VLDWREFKANYDNEFKCRVKYNLYSLAVTVNSKLWKLEIWFILMNEKCMCALFYEFDGLKSVCDVKIMFRVLCPFSRGISNCRGCSVFPGLQPTFFNLEKWKNRYEITSCLSVCVFPPNVAKQRLSKHVLAATIKHATSELFDAVFSVRCLS
jgi:hypothetical protein